MTEAQQKGSGSGVVVLSTAVVSALNYLYTITLIWLLPPGQYVVVGSISALLLIGGTVSGASVPWVLAKEVGASEAGSLRRQRAMSFAAAATLAQSLCAGAATALVAARYSSSPVVIAALASVVVIFGAASAVGYLQGQLRFRLIALLRTAEVVVKIGAGVGLVLLGCGATGAIAGFALGAAVVAAGALLAMKRDFAWHLDAVFDTELWRCATGLFWIQAGAAIIASLDIVTGSLVLGRDPHFATYQAANVLGRVPLYVGAALSMVAFPVMARAGADREREVRGSLWLFVRVCVPVLVVAATLPKSVVAHLFPASYGNVAAVLDWAALAGFALGLVNLTTTYFQAAGIVRRTILTLGAGIGAGAVLDYFGLRLGGNRGLALAVAIGAGAVSLSLLADVRRNWPGSLRSLGRTTLATAALTLPLWLVRGQLWLWALAVLACVVAPALGALYKAEVKRPAGRPRVLHLGYEDPLSPGAGGGSVRTHEINRRLAAEFDITVACAGYQGCQPHVTDGVRYVHIGFGHRYIVRVMSYFASVPYALVRYRSDLVVEDFGAPLSSVCVPWMTRRPVIGVVQWLFAKEKAAQYRLPFHLVERAGVASHRHLIAVSHGLGDQLQAMNPAASVLVVPNGLSTRAPGGAPARSGIVYLGRLEIAQKGLDLLLAAYAQIASSVPQDLVMGGDGPDRDALGALASCLGVADRVHFVGRVGADERFGFLAGAEVVAMPSRYETFGMVAAEALSVGTPVVAFDIACLREVVDPATGVLVPAYDVDAFAAALRRLALAPGEARQLGEAGPAKVAPLNWDLLARQQGLAYRLHLPATPALDIEVDEAAVRDSPVAGASSLSSTADWAVGEQTAVELFALQVQRTPDAPAVSDGQTELTYAQLADEAGAMAARLVEGGLLAGDTVGVYSERSTAAIVACLGIMAAGCAYVPLSPDLPEARLAQMCATANVQAVIGGPGTTFPVGITTIEPPDGPSAGGAGCLGFPSPEGLAYVMFTSGSTGVPKAVQLTHRNLSMMLRWLVDEIGPDMACASASTSFSFDPSMMELFGPLVCGGKIELVQEALALVPEGRRPTWTFTTPSIAAELLRAGRVPTSVRVLTLGGEVVTPALARGLLALPHLRRLVNVYGPTEAAVVTTRYEVTAPVGAVVPMGTAVPGTEVLVVDAHLCPVAPGEVGELLLLGPQVALGYANNPAATAKSFIEVAGADGSLVPTYRTGDLVREVAGQLEFCGRADRQVKLRGFRVDLAGIEASLLGLASVARAKVLVSGAGSDAALVACVVPSAGSFDEKAAKEHLKAELPRYMVPGRFLTCDAFPLTPNGKLDEAALLARFGQRPAMSRPAGSRSLSGTEAAIAHLIGEVLDTASPTFGSADFLDDLGGTSLGLVQLLAMMEESFGCKLPVRSAFGDTTVSGLANLVDDGESQASPAGPAPSRLGGGTLFFVNPYVGSAVRFRRLAQHLGKGTRAVGLHVQADNGQRSVAGMAAEAIVQMKAAQPEGPYLLGGHSAGGVVALEMARLLRSGGQTADVLLLDTTAQMSWLDAAWATLVLNWPTFKHAPMPERFRLVRRAMGRTPGGFGDGLAGTVDERARLTNAAVRQYHPTPYDGDVTLLWTDHGRRMARGRKDLGWGQLVSGRLDSRWVPGDHINMFDSPNVDALAKEVRRFVDDTTAMAGLTSWLETSAAAAAGAGQP